MSFKVWVTLLGIVSCSSIHLPGNYTISFFNGWIVLLCKCSTFSFPIHPLKDILAVSSSWIFWKRHKWMWLCKYFYSRVQYPLGLRNAKQASRFYSFEKRSWGISIPSFYRTAIPTSTVAVQVCISNISGWVFSLLHT